MKLKKIVRMTVCFVLAFLMVFCTFGCGTVPGDNGEEQSPDNSVDAMQNDTPEIQEDSDKEQPEQESEEPVMNAKNRDLSKITGPVMALTFDDGPSNTTTQILDVLEKYGINASFFIVGAWADDPGDRDIMKRAVDMGCTIENHTWNHKNLREMTVEEITQQYQSVQDYVYEIVGDYPKFFRAPGLGVNEQVYETIPLTFINGSGGSSDWNSKEDDDRTSDLETRVQGILSVAKDGHIYLLHDCSNNHLTPEALDIALPQLIEQGYTFVNIRELFEIKGQELTPDLNFSWTDVKKVQE